jgi:hypothetical protein
MSWERKMTEALADLKAQGMGFREAWDHALLLHPPRGRYYGPRQPELGDESMLEFLERACDDAWHGRRPALQDLPILMEAIGQDRSSFARKKTIGVKRKAAA